AHRDLHRLAQTPHRILRPVGIDELILHRDSLAKYRAAFFKMSFSSFRRKFSLRSRSSSPSAGRPRLAGTPVGFSASNCLRHLKSWLTRMPSSLATWLEVLSPISASRIASSLNSRLYCL